MIFQFTAWSEIPGCREREPRQSPVGLTKLSRESPWIRQTKAARICKTNTRGEG